MKTYHKSNLGGQPDYGSTHPEEDIEYWDDIKESDIPKDAGYINKVGFNKIWEADGRIYLSEDADGQPDDVQPGDVSVWVGTKVADIDGYYYEVESGKK